MKALQGNCSISLTTYKDIVGRAVREKVMSLEFLSVTVMDMETTKNKKTTNQQLP